jgi:hypothetical protein
MPSKQEGQAHGSRAQELVGKARELMRSLPAVLGFHGAGGIVKILYAALKAAPNYRQELEIALGHGATISVSSADAGVSARNIIGGRIVANLLERGAISDPLLKEAFPGLSGDASQAGRSAGDAFGRAISEMLDWAGEEDCVEAIRAVCEARGSAWKSLKERRDIPGAPSPSAIELAAAAVPSGLETVIDLGSGSFEACRFLASEELAGARILCCAPGGKRSAPFLMAMKALGRDAAPTPFDSGGDLVTHGLVICHPSLMDLEGQSAPGQIMQGTFGMLEPHSAGAASRRRIDSLWILKALELLGGCGSVAVFLPLSFTSLARFAKMRSYLLEKNLLNAVVSLPSGLYHDASLPMVMLVLRNNSEAVRLVDASAIKVGPGGLIDEELVSALAEAARGCGKAPRKVRSAEVDASELLTKAKAVLDPAKVIYGIKTWSKGVKTVRLGEIAEVLRGPLLKPGVLNEIMTEPLDDEDPCCFVALSDINGGILREVQSGLSQLHPEWLKNRMRDGDLLLSRNASPLRMSIARLGGDRPAVLSSNVYALRFGSIEDALWVYAYFSSMAGREALKAAGTGTLMSILSVKKLKELKIPACTEELKQKIARRCQEAIERLEKARQELWNAEGALSDSFIFQGDEYQAVNGSDDDIPF